MGGTAVDDDYDAALARWEGEGGAAGTAWLYQQERRALDWGKLELWLYMGRLRAERTQTPGH